MPRKWFQSWFNSPYYHILYHQRNDAEAEFFIDNLCEFLKPAANARLFDIACGRGRHAIYLNKKGYEVTGIDLSEANIRFAKDFENEHLHFYVHDMRHLFYINYFDIAFNLFTSFGYFETQKDHLKALKMFNKSLKPDGLMVFDYFNTHKIIHHLSHQEVKLIDGIEFHISKQVVEGKIVKTIAFEHHGKDYGFKEEVQAFSSADFELMFKNSGFEIIHQFGNYQLQPFDELQSDRLIFICRKTNA
ncbi:MAG: class I SAM-dependent methyltransferase [Sphingobacteriaceae bacterium]